MNFWKTSTIVLAIIVIFLTRCGGEPKTITVKVPEIIRQTDTVFLPKPYAVHVPVYDTIYETATQVVRDSLYYDAITIREYSETFTDSFQSITTNAKVKGVLLELSNNYHIFGRETQIEIKPSNALFLYGGTKYSIVDKKPAFEAKIILKNKRDRLLSFGADTNGNILAGYGFKL
jgi:hypothetical protein